MVCCLTAPNHYLSQYWLLVRSRGIHLRAILWEMLKYMLIWYMKITNSRLKPHLPEANELNHHYYHPGINRSIWFYPRTPRCWMTLIISVTFISDWTMVVPLPRKTGAISHESVYTGDVARGYVARVIGITADSLVPGRGHGTLLYYDISIQYRQDILWSREIYV